MIPSLPNRWSKEEEVKLDYMKEVMKEELAAAPQFPEVVGDRKLMRMVRAYPEDIELSIKAMRNFLQW
jgi:hypothetical protein